MLIAALVVSVATFVGPPPPLDEAEHLCSWQPARPSPRIAPAAAIYFGGRALDLALTEYGLSRPGLREGSPWQQSRTTRFTVSLGIASAMTWYDLREQRRGRSPKVARAVFIVGHAALVGWNVRQLVRQRRANGAAVTP